MKSSAARVVLVAWFVWLGFPTVCTAGFFNRHWGDVVVVTDMTAAGREITRPTREKPVYYRGMTLGCKLGSIPGDDLPPVEEISRFVGKVLAKQGYLPAKPGVHEPSLFIVLQWGCIDQAREQVWFLGYDPRKDIGAPIMAGMLGPEVFRLNMRSRVVETIIDYARVPIYGIIVTAFEYKSANTPKPVVYWQTRMALPTNGKSMAEALPPMAIAAGPSFGRETETPVLSDADDARQGQVSFGELRVIDFYENGAGAGDPPRSQDTP